MLYHSTVEPSTMGLLKKLLSIPELRDFYLVGGTALSLRYGHRLSVDLDLFSIKEFHNQDIINAIERHFVDFSFRSSTNPVGVFGYINNVKVDFVRHHQFNVIDEVSEQEDVRMFGDKDIVAMKVFAILQRAQKKDFWDMAELLQKYTVKQVIQFYTEKYPSNQMLIAIPHALTYFDDAAESEEPVSLKSQTWESVKKIISHKVGLYLS
jgi:predicted nucleotidyltransferase component of viral defense system